MSIGQEISLTAVQLVAAVSAIANGGRLMQPQIVRELTDTEAQHTERLFESRVVRQVVSPDTARILTDMMVNVVANGTGKRASIAGYPVAGKTGTAQKLDKATRRYSRAPGVLSFVGFAPADDPRLTLLVMLDEPKNEKWGSEAAAPVFAAIARESLRHLNVPPRDETPVALLRGGPVGGGADGAPAEPAEPARLVGLAETEGGSGVMPRVLGLSLRQAMETLAPFDVGVTVTGRGLVVGQTPPPGSPVESGSLCHLALASLAAAPAKGP
jgi:cell division protein FtsI (penicillin-binding protein 3)